MASTIPSAFGLKSLPPALTEFVILPEVMLVMAYALVTRIWSIWAFLTSRFLRLDESNPDPYRMVPGLLLCTVTAVHIAFLVLLVFAWRRVRRSSPSLRQGHYASLVLGVAIIVLLQVAAFSGHLVHVSAMGSR
ncbi:MAG: hypothetical protein ACI8QS_002109 [Planctomycetota bacterium]|jgi:hypothetical protein